MPVDVSSIAIRPVWQLSDLEERRTRRMTVDYAPSSRPSTTSSAPRACRSISSRGALLRAFPVARSGGRRAWPVLLLAAFVLGAAHAIQPGHGKTIVAASTLGPGSGPTRGALLGLATATTHMASVALIAATLWATRSTRSGEIHLALARIAGFAIAAVGLWRLGRHVAGLGEHEHRDDRSRRPSRSRVHPARPGRGVVPCWDAVALISCLGGPRPTPARPGPSGRLQPGHGERARDRRTRRRAVPGFGRPIRPSKALGTVDWHRRRVDSVCHRCFHDGELTVDRGRGCPIDAGFMAAEWWAR